MNQPQNYEGLSNLLVDGWEASSYLINEVHFD